MGAASVRPAAKIVREHNYIAGRWVEPGGTARADVVDSFTEQVIGSVPRSTPADVDRAVAAARAALPLWAATPRAERAAVLRRILAGIQARAEEIAVLWSREVGMPIAVSRAATLGLPVTSLTAYAELAETQSLEEEFPRSLVVKEPYGVAACITPWNYPMNQMAVKAGAALAAGCTVVGKPSAIAPLSVYVLAEIIDAAGAPPGVFNLVCGDGAGVGEPLAAHPGVDIISFTGSTEVGVRIMELAARGITKVCLELGGKSPALVLDEASLERAVAATVTGCYRNNGQTCTAPTRLLVPRALLGRAADLARAAADAQVVGDPLDPATTLGPLVSAGQRERVRAHIRTGIAEGAVLVAGGADAPAGLPSGYFVRPTVFTRVESGMRIAQEEIFGPVLAIIAVDGDDDAVHVANDSEFGLAATIWAEDPARAMALARRVAAGAVTVNGAAFDGLAPYGGYRSSGLGRELGRVGVDEFFQLKTIHR